MNDEAVKKIPVSCFAQEVDGVIGTSTCDAAGTFDGLVTATRPLAVVPRARARLDVPSNIGKLITKRVARKDQRLTSN